MSVCVCVQISLPLIGQNKNAYFLEEVIEMDELDEANIDVAAGK